MNSDLPNELDPREELEARVTALLLGELSEREAAELRVAIAQDPELAQLRERLARTIDLVREVTQTAAEPATTQTAPLKLSAERREKLLAHFKTVVPQEFTPKRKRELSWLLPVAAAILILLVGSFAILPAFTRAKSSAQSAYYGRAAGVAGNEFFAATEFELARKLTESEALVTELNSPSPTKGGAESHFGSFAPHPDPLPKEREEKGEVTRRYLTPSPVPARNLTLPRPKGEGRGEGKEDVADLFAQDREMRPAQSGARAAENSTSDKSTSWSASLATRGFYDEYSAPDPAKKPQSGVVLPSEQKAEVAYGIPADRPAILSAKRATTDFDVDNLSLLAADSESKNRNDFTGRYAFIVPPGSASPAQPQELKKLAELQAQPLDRLEDQLAANFRFQDKAQNQKARGDQLGRVVLPTAEPRAGGSGGDLALNWSEGGQTRNWGIAGNGNGNVQPSGQTQERFFSGLTRDDVGGLGFTYSARYYDQSKEQPADATTQSGRDGWFAGDENGGRGRVVGTAGSSPSFSGGGSGPNPPTTFPAATDGFLTSGLRTDAPKPVMGSGAATNAFHFSLGSTRSDSELADYVATLPKGGAEGAVASAGVAGQPGGGGQDNFGDLGFGRIGGGGLGGQGGGLGGRGLDDPGPLVARGDSNVRGEGESSVNRRLALARAATPAPAQGPTGPVASSTPARATQTTWEFESAGARIGPATGLPQAAEGIVALNRESTPTPTAVPPAGAAGPRGGGGGGGRGGRGRGPAPTQPQLTTPLAQVAQRSSEAMPVQLDIAAGEKSADSLDFTPIHGASRPESLAKGLSEPAAGNQLFANGSQTDFGTMREEDRLEAGKPVDQKSSAATSVLGDTPLLGNLFARTNAARPADKSSEGMSKSASVQTINLDNLDPALVQQTLQSLFPSRSGVRATTGTTTRTSGMIASFASARTGAGGSQILGEGFSSQLPADHYEGGGGSMGGGGVVRFNEQLKESSEGKSKAAAEVIDLAAITTAGKDSLTDESLRRRSNIALPGVQLAEVAQYGRGGNLGTADIAYDPETRNLVVVADDETHGQIQELTRGLKREQAAGGQGQQANVQTGTLVQNGRVLFEMGKTQEAEAFFRQALAKDPGNQAAAHYEKLLQEDRFARNERRKEVVAKGGGFVSVENSWESSGKANELPVPNPYASTNLVRSGQGRQEIAQLQELESLTKLRDALAVKLASEKVDAGIPKTATVTVVDQAQVQPDKPRTLSERFRGEVERTARLKVEGDVADVGTMGVGLQGRSYDLYFMQTEPEIIQSELVLGKVVEKLNLEKAWAKNNASGGSLKKEDAIRMLREKLDVRTDKNTSLLEIGAKSAKPEEAATLANAVAEAYQDFRKESSRQLRERTIKTLETELAGQEQKIAVTQEQLAQVPQATSALQTDEPPPVRTPPPNAPIPQPEIAARDNAFSTFSLNVSDVAFKLAAASLEKGQMPDANSVRSEEFINAFDYRDPEPPGGQPVGFNWERARYPFAHNRDLLRFSLKTAAAGRQAGRPLNLVLLLDNSGSMERADRVQIIRAAVRVLADQLQPQDKLSVITFARTARLWVDGAPGSDAGAVAMAASEITPQGGTNLEEAMNLAYATALRHYVSAGMNRVVLLTDGAANLGNVDPEALKPKVEAHRKQGIALDAFGIGWEGFNDDLLETLSRNGDGRYGFLNSPVEAATEFAAKLAGALQVAASDVKVQVEFNPKRVTSYRQIGYAKHQLTKEQFRDNTVDAAEIAAQEAGNALYTVEVNPAGQGPLGTVRVRYKVPGTTEYREQAWDVPFNGNAVALEQASPAMRLSASASAFSEWLVASPFAAEVTPDRLLASLSGVPDVYGADERPKKLEWMIRQAKSIAGK